MKTPVDEQYKYEYNPDWWNSRTSWPGLSWKMAIKRVLFFVVDIQAQLRSALSLFIRRDIRLRQKQLMSCAIMPRILQCAANITSRWTETKHKFATIWTAIRDRTFLTNFDGSLGSIMVWYPCYGIRKKTGAICAYIGISAKTANT